MPKSITFDRLSIANVTIAVDVTGKPSLTVHYSWLADNGETREQSPLNIWPVIEKNKADVANTIRQLLADIEDAVMVRDGIK